MDPLGDIRIPEEFDQFAGFFFDEDDEGPPISLEQLIYRTAEIVTLGRNIDALIQFLDTLLDGGASDAALDRIWWRTSPTWGIRLGFHHNIYEQIRQAAIEIRRKRSAG